MIVKQKIFGYCGGLGAVGLFVNRSAMFVEAVFMYQSNRSFNIPSPGIPRAFDHYPLVVGNLIASFDFMLRVALIPRGVINHDEDKPSCVQSERYTIRGGLAEKQRLAQALFCI